MIAEEIETVAICILTKWLHLNWVESVECQAL